MIIDSSFLPPFANRTVLESAEVPRCVTVLERVAAMLSQIAEEFAKVDGSMTALVFAEVRQLTTATEFVVETLYSIVPAFVAVAL